MRLIANRKNLKKFGKELLGAEYSEEKLKELIECVENGFEKSSIGHVSHSHYDHLKKLDKILNNHGVETIFEKGRYMDIQYSNTGDSYGITLLYYKDKLWVGDWGSIVEELS